MTEWISLAVAVAALAYTVWASLHERRNRRTELDLLRQQVSVQVAEQEALLHAHIGARLRETQAFEDVDRHHFELTNAGRAFARHIAGLLQDAMGVVVAGPVNAQDYGIQPGESTDLFIDVPQSARDLPLRLVIGWVDAAGNEAWKDYEQREWRVAAAIEPRSS